MTEPLGSAAEEALKLLGAAQEWVRDRIPAAGGLGHLAGEEHLATGSPECLSCPICQAVGALRHVKPETVEHLMDATASFVAALRAAFVSPPDRPASPPSPVQHIDVREG